MSNPHLTFTLNADQCTTKHSFEFNGALHLVIGDESLSPYQLPLVYLGHTRHGDDIWAVDPAFHDMAHTWVRSGALTPVRIKATF